MNTAERLLNAAKDIRNAYNEHPFVLGIQSGTLDREKFRRYMIQDCLYLKDYAKIFAIGVAKARDIQIANLFAKYIQVMNGELDVHSGYLARLGITQEEICSASPSLENISYTSYMLRVAYEEGEAEILAAVLACACSYESIAKKMILTNPDAVNDTFYGDWIKSYLSDAYSTDNRILLETLNTLTGDFTEVQLKHLVEIFINCSLYELAFWEMSWNDR